ncbi:MAG: ATP synthase F1 subunit epsilon [Armatimonadota bacterium]|jgi:F-type H+-transporting ATPase subunit epsilon
MAERADADTFTLRVLTPMGEALNMDASALRVPAWDGQLGVLARHAPMIALLRIGSSVVTGPDGRRRWLATVGGVLRVKRDEVVMLVDAAEEADEIDVERAHRALARAQQRLATRADDTDIARAEMALARAANRLRVAESAGARTI